MTPSQLHFPFWLITQRRGPHSVPVFVGSVLGYVACFRSPRDATDFMVGRGETGWEFRLVARADLPALTAELQAAGALGLMQDPGGAAMRVNLGELGGV